MKNFAIVRLYCGGSGGDGFYNMQELGLAKALVAYQYHVYIFLPSVKKQSVRKESIGENITIVYVPFKCIGDHGFFDCNILIDYKIDIVHLLSDNQIFAPHVMKFCKGSGIKCYNYVGTVFSDSHNFLKRFVMNILAKRNINYLKKSLIFAKTPALQRQLDEQGVKAILAPVGLDFNIIPKVTESKEVLRGKLGLPLDKKILIFVGRLEEYKQPFDAVELLYWLPDQYLLLLIGKGNLKDELFNKIKTYRLENRVKYIETVPNKEIHCYYKLADCFVNFNQQEIFGMSILEAMYQGCPVVARHAPGPDFIIDKGVTGFLCDDLKTMMHALENLDENMGIKSKERIINMFNWDYTCEKILRVLN